MTQADHDRIPALHATYVRLYGQAVPLTMGFIGRWEAWLVRGWTQADLVLVMELLKRKTRDSRPGFRKSASCLRIENLLEEDGFAMDLAEARAAARASRPVPARESVLNQTGRATPTEGPPAKTPAQIMAECEMFRRFRESL